MLDALFSGGLWNSFREINTKASFCAIVSSLRRDPSNIHKITFLVMTIPDLTPDLSAVFVIEIAFLLTHQVHNDTSLRPSDRSEILLPLTPRLRIFVLMSFGPPLNRLNAFASRPSPFLIFLFCHWYQGIFMCGTTSLTRKHRNRNLIHIYFGYGPIEYPHSL